LLLGVIALSASFISGWLTSLDFDQIFNLIEALLWMTISVVFLIRRRKQKNFRNLSFAASLAFFAFGISDLIEIQTRAWYEPIGLFLFKAACVATFLILLILYIKRSKETEQGA